MSKKKVTDYALVDSIQQYNDIGKRLFAPQFNVDTYIDYATAPKSTVVPDDVNRVGDAFNDFMSSYYSTKKSTAFGEYIQNDEDYNALLGVKDYINATREILTLGKRRHEGDLSEEITHRINELQQIRQQNEEAYSKVMGDGMWNGSLNSRIKDLINSGQYDTLNKEIYYQTQDRRDDKGNIINEDSLYAKREAARLEGEEFFDKQQKYQNKVSDYYRERAESIDLAFTNIDSYIYKVPGLLGSSSATMMQDIATTIGAAAAKAGVGVAVGSVAPGYGTAAGYIAGGAIGIIGSLASREQESKAEVYDNYKSKVQQTVQKKGITDDVMKQARAQMRQMGYSEAEINNDDYVYDQLITHKVKVNNSAFNRILSQNYEGLQSLYMDNMALATSDVAQTAMAIVPYGRAAKFIRGIKTLDKAFNKAEKVVEATRGLKKSIIDKLDDIATYSLEGVQALPKLTKRKAIREIGGKLVLTSIMEGVEEGTQYIKGYNYVNDKFEQDPNLLNSIISNAATGARSVFAALTPFDPLFSDDEEFIENFKAGAMLGGLMSGATVVPISVIRANKQVKADRVLASIFAEKIDQVDRFNKDMTYAQAIREGRFGNLQESFDQLSRLSIDGITPQDIQAERNLANEFYNLYTSRTLRNNAEESGVDTRTEDYDKYISVFRHHMLMLQEAIGNHAATNEQLQSLLNDQRITDHINGILPNATEEQKTQFREAISDYAFLNTYNRILENATAQKDKLQELENNTGLKSSKTNVFKFIQALPSKGQIEIRMNSLSEKMQVLGITEQQLEVPAIHNDLDVAIEKNIYTKADIDLANAELRVFEKKDKKLIRQKIDLLDGVEKKNDEYVDNLGKMHRGEPLTNPETDQDIQPETFEDKDPEPKPQPEPSTPPTPEPPAPSGAEAQPEVETQPATEPQQIAETTSTEPTQTQTQEEQHQDQPSVPTPETEERQQTPEQEQKESETKNEVKDKQRQPESQNTTPDDKETTTIPPVNDGSTKPVEVGLPSLGELLGDLVGQDAAAALDTAQQPQTQPQTQPEQPQQEQPQIGELTYDPFIDPYSHQLNYKLTKTQQDANGKWQRIPQKYQGMEQYLNNDGFAEISAKRDFMTEVIKNGVEIVVRPYFDGSQTVPAIYAIFNYKGNKYIAAVPTISGIQKNRGYQRRSSADQQIIMNNLQLLRNKILELNRQVQRNPKLKIVPTVIKRTTGRIVNVKDSNNNPVNKKLTDSAWMTIKDPYGINPSNTEVGISTGPTGRSYIRLGNRTISFNGSTMGKPVWIVKVQTDEGTVIDKPVVLNYADFKDEPDMADLILNLLTYPSTRYTDANGVQTTILPINLLKFIVNFGTQTVVNPNDQRLDKGQRANKLAKQFYENENGDIVMGTNVFSKSDLISNEVIRQQAKEYIMNNFHYNIDEDGLNRTWLGGGLQNQNRDTHFSDVEAWLRNGNVDSISIIPGKLEFSLKDFGITKNANGTKVVDESQPMGISVLGWYIKQGILLTDIADELQDANLYIDDVRLADTSEEVVQQQAVENLQKAAQESTGDVFEYTDENGNKTTVDMNDVFAILDGKKRGPNMEVEVTEDDRIQYNKEKMDEKQAREWLASTLGIDPKILDTVVEVTEAGNAVVGRVTEDSILLYRDAPEGTQYHEAWHRVSQLCISDKERRRIYDRYNRKHKTNLTDRELDEIYAEQFREFMLTEAANYEFDTNNWFRRIWDFIKLWFNTGQYALAKIYSNINRGKYYGIRPNAENVTRFRSIYQGEGPNFELNGYKFKTITSYRQLDDIAKSLTYAFFRVNFAEGHTIDYADINNNEYSFERLKLIVDAQAYKYPSEAMNEVRDSFDTVLLPMIQDRLKQLGIRSIEQNEADVTKIEEGQEGVNIGEHTVEGINISIKDNAPAEVKFFFQTIPLFERTDDGGYKAKLDDVTHFSRFVDASTAWNNILKDLAGCRTIKNIVAKVSTLAKNDLFYSALLLKLNNLIRESVSTDKRVATNAEAMLTKLETVITSDVNNFITVKINKDTETSDTVMTLVDNTVDFKASTYPRVWSANLFYNSGIFNYNKEGKVIAKPEAKQWLKQRIDRLNAMKTAFMNNKGIFRRGDTVVDLHIPANQEWLKDQIVQIFQDLGLGIDKPTINKMLLSGDYGNPKNDVYSLLNAFVVNVNNFGGLSRVIEIADTVRNAIKADGTLSEMRLYDTVINPTGVWNNIGYVKTLANYYAYVHATDSSLSSLGPDGNNYYIVSQNNFAKDRVHELVEDDQVREQLNSVVYNQNSIILKSVNAGNRRLQIETFINFKDNTSYDTGRDYFSITDREDYIAKLTAILNDRIVFPTVADKKTYHFIKGLILPHETINFTKLPNGRHNIRYGEQSLDIIRGYCIDELNQIELCLRQIDDDPAHYDAETGIHYNEDSTINHDWLPKDQRIKNFHTPNKYKDRNGKTHTIEGNGARFLFLTGIRVNGKFINFNDPTKSAKENLQTAKDYFFNAPIEAQKDMLSTLISYRVKKEIETSKSLGLITANENNDLWSIRNILLDSKTVKDRTNRYISLDPNNAEAYAVFDILADYTINSIISVCEVEKLFNGSPAYYKVQYDADGIVDVSVDKIKRLGALTSTGLNNRLDFFNNPIRQEYTVAELKDHEIADKQYYELEGLFYRGNIKETIQEMLGEDVWEENKHLSVKQLEEKFPEETSMAKKAAKVEVAGYKEGVNVADAAVYISPNMTRDMLRMRGEWSAEIEEAFDILTNPETADRWESDPELYAKANRVILNAMKYMAFGNRFRNGLAIPYFNKMALFPLFKSVATGDLKALYDRMVDENNPIDMVMFNSAVKAGSQNPMAAYRSAKDSEIELKDGQTVLSARLTNELESGEGNTLNDFNQLTTYKQSFKYLRQQLATDPHVHEESMAGTQFMKVNLSNLRMNDMYGREGEQVSGQTIKDTVINCLNALSDIGRQELQELLYNKDGIVNINNLSKMLMQDARESGANDNIITGLQAVRDKFDIPLSALSDNKWIESRFISMIAKEVIDVYTAGGAFIQRSAFGLEATSTRVITENMINDGKPLLMINEDGSMDSIVSINLLKHIIPDYNKKTFKEARQWLLDKGIIGPKAKANAIGYRIPTQSIASISALRFVDVYPEIMGDTITLPEGFTKLTGSDFDIDKLYIARLSYDKEGNLIQHGQGREKEAFANELLDAYLKVLLTKDNTNSLKLSIDNATENVKAVLKDIEGPTKYHPEVFEVYSPTYQEARKAEYTGGKAGIGPFALNNAHHILTQLTKLKMRSNAFTQALGITELGGIYDNPTTGTPKGGRILDWLSAMINAFVDIAKDPYIVRLNVNSWTYNMVSFLLRTGKGKWTFYFIGQPILKEMAEAVIKTKGKYGIDRTKTPTQLEKEAINQVLDKYDPNGTIRKKYEYLLQQNKDVLLSSEFGDLFQTYMVDGKETSRTREVLLGQNTNPAKFNEEQVRFYYAWLALKPYADSLANLVKYSKVDTKKMGKSFAEQDQYYNAMWAMTDDPNFAPGEVERFYNETFIARKTENSVQFGIRIFENLLFRNTSNFREQVRHVLALLGRSNNADGKLLNSIISPMEAQIKTEFFLQYAEQNGIDIAGLFKGRRTIAKRLNKFKNEILKGNPKYSYLLNSDGTIANDFLNFLLPNITEDGLDFIDISEMLNQDQSSANNLINYWRELLDDPTPEIKRFACDLAVYAFFTSGDNPAMNSFFQYLPNSFRKEIGYTDFVQSKLDSLVNESYDGYVQKHDLFLNNWTNDKLVRPVNLYSSRDVLLHINAKEDSIVPNVILGRMTQSSNPTIKPINWVTAFNELGNISKYPIFPPYIKINDGLGNNPKNWHVYQLIGFEQHYDKGRIQYTPMYGLVAKKGYKHKGHQIIEYGSRTRLDFNREYEWNYQDMFNYLDAMKNMASDFQKELWSDLELYPISELPSYTNGNFTVSEQEMVYEDNSDVDTEDDFSPVLEEKEEPNNTPQTQTESQTSPEQYNVYIDVETAKQEAVDSLYEMIEEGLLSNDVMGRFEQLLNDEKPSTREEVQGLLNKFICNL